MAADSRQSPPAGTDDDRHGSSGNASGDGDADGESETRVAAPPPGLDACRAPPDNGDFEGNATRVGPVPDTSFQDQQTRVSSLPTPEEMADLKTPSPYALNDDPDATRVAASPALMTTQETPTHVSEPVASDHEDLARQATQTGVGVPARDDSEPPDAQQTQTHIGSAALPAAPQPQSASPSDALPERRAIPEVGLPDDLRLPTFDFRASTSPDVMAAKAAGAHAPLPEHLQLPSFPDLGKPPVPKKEVSVPPPVPKKTAPPPPLPAITNPAAPVLDMSLPEFAPKPTQRNLTLIGSQDKNKRALGKRLLWPTIVGVACLGIAIAVFVARERVVASIAPKPATIVAPPPTAQELAKAALAAGGTAYMAKDYKVAIEQFDKALAYDPRLVEAQRSLGIVYATMHDQAKAVRHYQDYLALNPHAPDAADVQKIIDDYKHAQSKAAQAKPAQPAAPPPEAPKAHRKGAHPAHRR